MAVYCILFACVGTGVQYHELQYHLFGEHISRLAAITTYLLYAHSESEATEIPKLIDSIDALLEHFAIRDVSCTLPDNGLDSFKTVMFLNAAEQVSSTKCGAVTVLLWPSIVCIAAPS